MLKKGSAAVQPTLAFRARSVFHNVLLTKLMALRAEQEQMLTRSRGEM